MAVHGCSTIWLLRHELVIAVFLVCEWRPMVFVKSDKTTPNSAVKANHHSFSEVICFRLLKCSAPQMCNLCPRYGGKPSHVLSSRDLAQYPWASYLSLRSGYVLQRFFVALLTVATHVNTGRLTLGQHTDDQQLLLARSSASGVEASFARPS